MKILHIEYCGYQIFADVPRMRIRMLHFSLIFTPWVDTFHKMVVISFEELKKIYLGVTAIFQK